MLRSFPTPLGRVAAVLFFAMSTHPAVVLGDEGWRWRGNTEFTSEYNNNVFGLDSDGKDRVDDQDPVNRANGRLEDMESVDDLILTPRLAMTADTITPLGRLAITPRFAYHRYVENDGKSFSTFGLRLRQSLPQHSAVLLDFDYTLDAFKRNYLKDTIGTGVIDDTERVYDRGRYDDWEVELAYERRLWRGRSRDQALAWPSKLKGEILGGYGQRRFDNGFDNRDRDTWSGGFSLLSDFGEAVDVKLSYGFSNVDSPGDDEVLILDEPALGINLNGDADILDNDIRAVAAVDRSRDEHKMGVDVKIRPIRRVRTWVSYNYALRDYESDELFDLAYRDRRDDVHSLRVGARWKFLKGWAATLEGRFAFRDLNRDAAVVGDEDAKKRQSSVRMTFGRKF